MPDLETLQEFLNGAAVDAAVFSLRPDYRAVLLAVDRLVPGPSDEASDNPDPGEVVWCDDAGVTCRRWNWRQGQRTQLREDTTTALFILDALHPMTDEALDGAADDLAARLAGLGPDVRIARRRIAAAPSTHEGN
jgi:hypothetical protein